MKLLRQFVPVMILLLAAVLRLYQPGLWNTWVDELNIIHAAQGIVYRGDWTWIGNESSFGALAAHSPFASYVTAIPALISPHPIVMRWFYAFLGIITVALTFRMMKRQVGYPSAVIASTLLAIMPLPVYWSRFVWNPNLAPLFLIICLDTAIEGYAKGNRRAQYIHWIALTLAIHAQTALVSLLPISIALALFSLREPQKRLMMIRRHLLIMGAMFLSLLPWLYGLYGIRQGWWQVALSAGNFDSGELSLTIPSFEMIINQFSLLTASVHYWQFNLRNTVDAPGWWFPDEAYFLLYIQAFITAIALLYLMIKQRQRAWFIVASTIFPLLILFVNRRLSDFYMMSSVYAGIIAFSWMMQVLISRSRLFVAPVILFMSLQLWLTASMFGWHAYDPGLWRYDEIIKLVDTWQSGEADVLVWEYDPASSPVEQHKWRTHWQILSEVYPIRFITSPESLPIAENQYLIVDSEDMTWLDFPQEGEIYQNNERSFIRIALDTSMYPAPDYHPATSDNFDNLASVSGLSVQSLAPGLETLYLYWHPQTEIEANYQISLRLVDAEGQVLAQKDQTSLQSALWREGDTVVSFIEMMIPDNLPDSDSLAFDLVLYQYPENIIVPLVDSNGNRISDIMRLSSN